MGEMVKLGLTLAVICMISGWSLSTANFLTGEKITQFMRSQEEEARSAVLMPESLNLLDFPQGEYFWTDEKGRESIKVPLSELHTIDDIISYEYPADYRIERENLDSVQRKINEYQKVDPSSVTGPEAIVMNAVKRALLSKIQFKERIFAALDMQIAGKDETKYISLSRDSLLLTGKIGEIPISFMEGKKGLYPFRIGERAWEGLGEGEKVSLGANGELIKKEDFVVPMIIFHEAMVGKQIFGAVLKVSPSGYAGEIEALVGIGRDGRVNGVKVLAHSETPGLGARMNEINPTMTERLAGKLGRQDLEIDKPWFLEQYKGLKVGDLKLMKDDPNGKIDAITAATITSRALTRGIRSGVELYNNISQKGGIN